MTTPEDHVAPLPAAPGPDCADPQGAIRQEILLVGGVGLALSASLEV